MTGEALDGIQIGTFRLPQASDAEARDASVVSLISPRRPVETVETCHDVEKTEPQKLLCSPSLLLRVEESELWITVVVSAASGGSDSHLHCEWFVLGLYFRMLAVQGAFQCESFKLHWLEKGASSIVSLLDQMADV